MSKIDYGLKAEVIRVGLDTYERKLSNRCFVKNDYKEYIDNICYFSDNNSIEIFLEARKVNHARYERTKRLRKRINSFMFDINDGTYNDCVFVTLTFNDDVLKNTTPLERRKAVSRYLKSQSNKYVANIDFGAKNKREHYHAVVACKMLDMQPWLNKYGFILSERVKVGTKKCDLKLAKYVSKLTNHAIKETTKRQALIYSR